jgi:hypothetical protein
MSNYPAGVNDSDFNDDPDGLEEEEYSPCEFHEVAVNSDGECPVCLEEMKKQQAYYGALYRAEHRYTREEIMDAYSDPTERAKRTRLLENL